MMEFGVFKEAVDRNGGLAPAGGRLVENGKPTDKGKNYVIHADLAAAIDVATALGRPLLVSGEPGCGKTELGYAVARVLGIQNVHFFSVTSSVDAGDLFYVYDALARFRDAQLEQFRLKGGPAMAVASDADVAQYIEFRALGRAILDAHARSEVSHLLRPGSTYVHPREPCRSVVVIDEIDKAPRDFPNDVLRQIEDLSFRVKEFPSVDGREPETPTGDTLRAALRPIVIVTSNEERQLPDAFLRRCIFHRIPFPERDDLIKIVAKGVGTRLARMYGAGGAPGEKAPSEDTIGGLVDAVLAFRAQLPDKRPGIAEALDAAALLAIANDTSPRLAKPALVKLDRDGVLFDKVVPA